MNADVWCVYDVWPVTSLLHCQHTHPQTSCGGSAAALWPGHQLGAPWLRSCRLLPLLTDPAPRSFEMQRAHYLRRLACAVGGQHQQKGIATCLIATAATAQEIRTASCGPTPTSPCPQTTSSGCTKSTALKSLTAMSISTTFVVKLTPIPIFFPLLHRRFQATLKTRSLSCQFARASSRQLRLHSLKNPQ